MRRDEKLSILSYSLFAVTLAHMLTHVLQRVHIALFPIIREEYRLSLRELGLMASIPPLIQAFLTLPMGFLADRFGSKRMILLNLSIAALGSLLAWRSMNPWMLVAAVSLIYMNSAIYHPAAYSLVSKLFSPRDRPKALGIQGAGGTLGLSLGPISAGLLMALLPITWRGVYLFWLIPILVGIISILPIRYEPKLDVGEELEEVEEASSMLSLSFILFLLFVSLRTMGGQMIASFITLYLVDVRQLSQAVSSIVYGASSLVGIFAAPLGGFLASRFGEKRWLLLTLSGAYISIALAAVAPTPLIFTPLYILYGFLTTLGMPANSSIIARLSPSSHRGLAYSLLFLPPSVMGALSPTLASLIAEVYGLPAIFPLSLIISAVGLAILKFSVKV